MHLDEVRSLLTKRQIKFDERGIDYGTQFRCAGGEVVNVYTSGKVVLGGKDTPLARAIRDLDNDVTALEDAEDANLKKSPSGIDNRVFIVYGHDLTARDALELLLRRMGMEPIILENLPAAGDTVIEKLESYVGAHGSIGFACVLLTPDDEGHKAGKPEEKRYRARQNVVLELGMVLARLGRSRVAILYKETVEQPSDIAGLIYVPFQERIDEVKTMLFRELQAAGYKPDPGGL